MPDLIEIICRKTKTYRDTFHSQDVGDLTTSDVLALFGMALAHGHSGPVNVIDFGGACGAHYFRIKSLFRDNLQLNWHVVETASMAGRAKELSNHELQFFDSLSAARASFDYVDVVYSSGTLQYVSDPLETLTDLLACTARYVVLARLGLARDESSIITIQESRLSDNGPGPMPPGFKDGVARYPVTFAAQTRIESMLSEDHKILLRLPDASVASAYDRRVLGLGYVAELKSAAR